MPQQEEKNIAKNCLSSVSVWKHLLITRHLHFWLRTPNLASTAKHTNTQIPIDSHAGHQWRDSEAIAVRSKGHK